jgi:hypothetical protein
VNPVGSQGKCHVRRDSRSKGPEAGMFNVPEKMMTEPGSEAVSKARRP